MVNLQGDSMRHSVFTKSLGLFFLLVSMAWAHGPTPQKADESITVNAGVDKVWDLVKDFAGLVNWHPDVKSSQGDGKLASGGVRTLVLQNGGELQEELDFYSEQDHEYIYRLKKENTAAFPVSSYSINLKVAPAEQANQSVVTLKGRFYRGDTGNTPADNQNDAAAVKAMTAFLKNGLANLQKKFP